MYCSVQSMSERCSRVGVPQAVLTSGSGGLAFVAPPCRKKHGHCTIEEEPVAASLTRLHLPQSKGYVRGTRLWNGAIVKTPAAVARPQSLEEVQSLVHHARDDRLTVSVRGGGHDWAGRALNDGGLVIDMSAMRGVRVDASRREALVEGGATIDDVVSAAEDHGLTAATGVVGDVGMVGFTLAGGYGPLNGVAGLGLDNLLDAQVVLADGSAVTAAEDSLPDLFWALRGGGANFGVVTSTRIRLHPLPTVVAGVMMYPLDQAGDVLAGFAATVPTMPDQLTVQTGMMTAPDGTPVVIVAPTWAGDAAESVPWVDRLKRLGSPLAAEVDLIPRSVQIHLVDEIVPPGRHYEMRTCNVTALTPDVIAALVAGGAARTSQASAIYLHHFHGAAARVGVTATAFAARAPHFMVEILAAWDSGDPAPHVDWARALYDDLAVHALPGGYPNLIGPDRSDQADHAYGPNVRRLLTAKAKWDGEGMFSATPLPSGTQS